MNRGRYPQRLKYGWNYRDNDGLSSGTVVDGERNILSPPVDHEDLACDDVTPSIEIHCPHCGHFLFDQQSTKLDGCPLCGDTQAYALTYDHKSARRLKREKLRAPGIPT